MAGVVISNYCENERLEYWGVGLNQKKGQNSQLLDASHYESLEEASCV